MSVSAKRDESLALHADQLDAMIDASRAERQREFAGCLMTVATAARLGPEVLGRLESHLLKFNDQLLAAAGIRVEMEVIDMAPLRGDMDPHQK